MERVLVTGSSGFTARYVIPALGAADFEVWGLCHHTASGPRVLVADITDLRAVEDVIMRVQPSYVLHLAGTPSLPDSEIDTLRAVNVEGTRNVLSACAGLSVRPRRIVLASSGYVYGDTGGGPATEDQRANPIGEYGKSKLEMERVASGFRGRLPILIARPFNYTGVAHDARFIIPKLVKAYQTHAREISFADTYVVRDFSDVRWVASTYAQLLVAPENLDIVNICNGKGRSLGEIIELLDQISGYRPSSGERDLDHAIASPIRTLVGSNSRLKSAGIALSPYSLRETLRWMFSSGVSG